MAPNGETETCRWWNYSQLELHPGLLCYFSAGGVCAEEREGENKTSRRFLDQNKRLVVHQCHFTVLRHLKHRHFPAAATVAACMIKRRRNHLSGLWWAPSAPGGRVSSRSLTMTGRKPCLLSRLQRPSRLMLGTKSLSKHFVDTGAPSHKG